MPSKRKTNPRIANAKKPARRSAGRKPKYSEESFWNLVRESFTAIGKATLTQAFTLYHALKDERTPAAARMTIVGALAYLILPTDLVPDFIPVFGFTDDAGAIAAALATVASAITSEHKSKAAKQAKELFS